MFQDYVDLIHRVLQSATRNKAFKTDRERFIYEKGYLIGMLASLAYMDSKNYFLIKKKIKK